MEISMETMLFCVSIFLSGIVHGLSSDEISDNIDDTIAKHPIIRQLMSRVAFLEERDKTNTEIISDMKIQLSKCNTDQSSLEKLETPDIYHQEPPNSLNEDNDTADKMDVLTQVKEQQQRLQTKPAKIKRKNMIRQVSDSETIAFFAKTTANNLHIGINQNIIFETIDTNIGKAFNSHHGLFVAPVSGTYVFSTTILAYNNAEVWVHFAVNGKSIANTYARGTDGPHDSGSQTVIVTLTQGDDVSVQSTSQDENIYGEAYTTFSGFLLSSSALEVMS